MYNLQMLLVAYDSLCKYHKSLQIIFSQRNTFQCILATDGRQSFSIFYYADGRITWTTGDASGGRSGLGGTPAQVGFNRGDGRTYATVPGSRTSSIVNIASTTNVGRNGVWIYRVNNDVIQTPGGNQLCKLYSLYVTSVKN